MSTDQHRHSGRPVVDVPEFVGRKGSARNRSDRPGPLRTYRRQVQVADVVVVTAACSVGYLVHFGLPLELDEAFAPYRALGIGLVLAWITALYVRGCYDERHLAVGPEEFSRLVSATVLLFAIVAGVGYFTSSDVSRIYVFLSLPLGLALLAIERWGLRRLLYRDRARGRACFRTVVVGTPERVADLVEQLSTDTYAGYHVVTTCGPPGDGPDALARWVADVSRVVADADADAVALTPSRRIGAEAVRRLAWALEGRGLDLLVAPALSDVAGPRITMRPAAGTPLIHLEEPGLSPAQRLAKRALDLLGAAVGVVVLAAPMAVVAVLVRLDSPGPVLFRQWRVGLNGEPFRIWKFRTMVDGADARRDALRADLGNGTPAFKVRDDPRVTRVGRVLRRWSIDEWPQLANVLRGEMSLVGPRPHPLDDVSRYGHEDFRRLLAKPGITGLWQVAGRSDLDWAEAIRLDLHYVENWSMGNDLVLIGRTARAVITGRGAT